MNALGKWIKSNTTRNEFAKEMNVTPDSVNVWCGVYGVPPKRAGEVSEATKIPESRLIGRKKPRIKAGVALTWGGVWVEKDL